MPPKVKFSPVTINISTLNETSRFEYLLYLEFTPDLKLNSYLQSIAKDVKKNGRLVLSLQEVPNFFCDALFLREPDHTENGVLLTYLYWSCATILFQQ